MVLSRRSTCLLPSLCYIHYPLKSSCWLCPGLFTKVNILHVHEPLSSFRGQMVACCHCIQIASLSSTNIIDCAFRTKKLYSATSRANEAASRNRQVCLQCWPTLRHQIPCSSPAASMSYQTKARLPQGNEVLGFCIPYKVHITPAPNSTHLCLTCHTQKTIIRYQRTIKSLQAQGAASKHTLWRCEGSNAMQCICGGLGLGQSE